MKSMRSFLAVGLLLCAGCQHHISSRPALDLEAIRLRLAVSDAEWSEILDLSTAYEGMQIIDMRYVDGGLLLVSLVKSNAGVDQVFVMKLGKENDRWVVVAVPEEHRIIDGTKYYPTTEGFPGR